MLPFADALRLTLGQPFLVQRSRERVALAALEVFLLASWAILRYGAKVDASWIPAAWSRAAAWAGLGLTMLGMGLAAWAKVRLGRWFSGTFAVKPGHELVTDGPYGLTRHPIYTGVLAAVVGSALVLDSRLLLLVAVALAASLARHASIEEALFVQHFGERYRRYQRRVPRLVPSIRPREDR